MIKKLSASLFIALGMALIGSGLAPILRYALGIDNTINMSLFTCTVFAIGGLMAGLTGMILLTRRQASILTRQNTDDKQKTKNQAILIHASGFLLYTGIPLANFLACFYLWTTQRDKSDSIDTHGIAALNFQMTVYLYLLLSLFLVFIFFGIISTLLILLFHFICTVFACIQASRGKVFDYPANIPVIK